MEDYVKISVERYEELREKEKAIESEMIKITGNYEYIYHGSFTETTILEPNAVYIGKDDVINGLVKDNIAKANALNEARKQHKKNKLELEDKIEKLEFALFNAKEIARYYKGHRFLRINNFEKRKGIEL
jgi:hypothetical protein